jgi:hypothetical protein
LRAGAEQRALRAFEDLDALHVDQVNVVVARRELHRLLIQVQRHVGEWRSGRLRLVARADTPQATHVDVAGAGSVAAVADVGCVLQQVAEGDDIQLLQLRTGDRLHGDRDVLHALGTTLCSDHHFAERGL